MTIGILIGLAVAAGLYLWKSNDKPAQAARKLFKRGRSGGVQPK